MILVLVGGEMADDGWLPGFQRVCVLVRAVPGAWEDTGGILLASVCYISDSTETHWHAGSHMNTLRFSQRQDIPSLGPSSLQETDKGSHFCY